MPCGRKKRRAEKRKNVAFANTSSSTDLTLTEEKLLAVAAELLEKESNIVSEDVIGKTVDDAVRDSNESQSVDQIAHEPPFTADSENEERSEDVSVESESVENKAKESESESASVDPIIQQVPLVNPNSKETEGNECAMEEVVEMVNDELSIEEVVEDPIKDSHGSIKEPCFVDLVSPVVQRNNNGHLNEMVSVFTALLKELRGMKAWHEQGIGRMTKISLQVRRLKRHLEEIGEKKGVIDEWQRSITEMSSQFSHLLEDLDSDS